MSFPPSKNPSDWQTAYSRDQAHRDSVKLAGGFILPVVLCALFFLSYTLFWAARSFLAAGPSMLRLVMEGLVAISAFIIFPIILISAFRSAEAFFTAFYRPPENINPGQIIRYRMLGKTKLPPPLNMLSQFQYILVKDGDTFPKDGWPAWSARNIGGPIILIVFDGYALYLERGNQFSRVVGPGEKVPFLEWYETIRYVVDLRPKIKLGTSDVWTKDGIKIKIESKIECRIGDPAKKPPSADLLYPFDPEAVKKAIERYSLRWPKRSEGGEPSEFTWIDAAWGQLTGILPGYISSRMLDDLVMAEREKGQILSPDALKNILATLNKATNGFGVYITDFQIQKIEFPDIVLKHQKDHWKAERQSFATIRDGQTKAFKIRLHEKERAEAQRNLIRTIASGLEKNNDSQFTESLLLSLPGLLDEGLKDPVLRSYLAKQKLETWEQMEKLSPKPPNKREGDSSVNFHKVDTPDDK